MVNSQDSSTGLSEQSAAPSQTSVASEGDGNLEPTRAEERPEEIRQLLEAERRQRLIAEELHAVAQRITAELSLDDALAAVLKAAEKMFGATSASILLAGQSEVQPNRRFTTRHSGQPHWDNHTRVRPSGITMTVLRSGQPIVVNSRETDPRVVAGRENVSAAFAAIPIRHGERVRGVLFVDWQDPHQVSPSDLRLLETLAAWGAIAIENARLHARDREAHRETEEARQRLQQFIGMVAHDLRGPLGVVATSLELLRESKRRNRAEVEQHVLPATENAIRRMRRLVDDLLGASRIGAGRFQIRPFPMDLIDVTRRVVEQHRGISPLHRLILDAPERLEGEWDPERVGQLLTNLISNAIKYSPDGGSVRITVRGDEECVMIRVADEGPGIPANRIRLLFQPFSRLDREPETEGLGLGLYIAKAIAEAHGGRIWVESEVGSGTAFYVELPMRNDLPDALSPDTVSPRNGPAALL